jgi:tetratricopeptide (TPR) repeat protein
LNSDKNDKALKYFNKALIIKKQVLPEDNLSIGNVLNNIAIIYAKFNELDRALGFFEESLKIKMANLDKNHPSVLFTANSIKSLKEQTN